MQIELAPFHKISDAKDVVVDILNGKVHALDREDAERLRTIARGGEFVKSEYISLLNREFALTCDIAEQRRSAVLKYVANMLKTHGSLCIMPTEKCNFRCTYCYESFLKGRMSPNLVGAVKLFLQSAVRNYERYDLAFFGGEPLLHVDIIEDISQTFRTTQEKLGIPGSIAITTNGHELNASTATRLSRVGIDLYHISLDGPQELHDSQRHLAGGRGTYATILSNIHATLRETSARVLLRINLDTQNPLKCERVKTWIEATIMPMFSPYGERVKIHVVAVWNATLTSVNGICIRDINEYQRWFAVRDAVFKYTGRLPLDAMIEECQGFGALSCYAGKPGHHIVGSDGQVYKCSVAFDLPENQVGQLLLNGTMIIDSEREIKWTGPNVNTDPTCGNCAFGASCMGIACPLVRIQTKIQPCPTHKKYAHQLLETHV